MLTLENVDLLSLTPDRACNVVEYAITRHMDEKARVKFDSELNRPLPGETVDDIDDGPWSAEGMSAAFEQAMKSTP
jgi:hypothetical protein